MKDLKPSIIVILFFSFLPRLGLANLASTEERIEPDFTKANIKAEKYETIPKNVLFFSKGQSQDPFSIFEKELKGYGWGEPFFNQVINDFRLKKYTVYVDYLTTAKMTQYNYKLDYQLCSLGTRQFKYYKKYQQRLNSNRKVQSTYVDISHPFLVLPKEGRIITLKEYLPRLEKHLYPNSSIYNIKSMLDDPNLYTAQQTNSGSAIKQYFYKNPEDINQGINSIYKKRVYDFVASQGEQLTFMIALKRMHWVDALVMGDYHYLINKNKPNFQDRFSQIVFIPFTHKDPTQLTNEDHSLIFFRCQHKDKKELDKMMAIINKNIKKIRTNEYFLRKIVKVFSEKTKVYSDKLEDFYFLKQNLLSKKLIDAGFYD